VRASFEAARLEVAARGLDRASLGGAIALRAAGRHPGEASVATAAWAAAESDLARGLSDELRPAGPCADSQ